jgi:transcriptional regulator with XRE-family HTH domain
VSEEQGDENTLEECRDEDRYPEVEPPEHTKVPGLTERLAAAGKEYSDLPGEHITVNQVISYNMARYRKAAGITQDELAKRLNGWTPKTWSKAAVSAAERSWDGKRIRQFDADLIYGLARAFDVPITALFLPPEDDGVERRYLIDPPYLTQGMNWAGCSNMHDLLTFVLSDSVDEDDIAVHTYDNAPMRDYRARLFAAVDFHYGSEADAMFRTVGDLNDEQLVLYRLEKLRGQYDSLRGILGDLGKMHDNLVDKLVTLRGPEFEAQRKADEERRQRFQAQMAERDERVKDRYKAGESVDAIAEAIGMTPRVVQVSLVRSGLLDRSVLDEAP